MIAGNAPDIIFVDAIGFHLQSVANCDDRSNLMKIIDAAREFPDAVVYTKLR